MRTEFLFIRRMPIHYVAPPVCDTDFTGTGEPGIVLTPHPSFEVTGLFVETVGDGFRLRWNTVVGGLCYNVYQLIGDEWVLIAECIPDTFYEVGPGVYSVSVITREGESRLSVAVNTSGSVGPAVVMTVVADQPVTVEGSGEPGVFRFIRNGPLAGNFFCRFTLTGTATFGALDDYTLSADSTLNHISGNIWEIFIPDNIAEERLYVTANLDATIEGSETVIVSLLATSNYAVGFPDTATVTIEECTAHIFDTGIYPIPAAQSHNLTESGFVGGQAFFPQTGLYFDGGLVPDTLNEVDSGTTLGTQVGNTLTTDAAFFSGAGDVGKIIVYNSGQIAQITVYVSPTEVTVVPSQTTSAQAFKLRTAPVGLPGAGITRADYITEAGIIAGDLASNDIFWFDMPNNDYRTPVTGFFGSRSTGLAEDGFMSLQIFDLGLGFWKSYLYNPNDLTLTDIGTLQVGNDTLCNGINSSHSIAATSDIGVNRQACKWVGGVLTDIHPAETGGLQHSDSIAINDSNELCGEFTHNVAPFRDGVFFHDGAVTTSIGSLGGNIYVGSGECFNENSMIVGNVETGAGTGIYLPYYWTPTEGIVLIPLLTGATQGIAISCNDLGWIVGEMSGEFFLYRDGVTEKIQDLPEVTGSGWTVGGNEQTLRVTNNKRICGQGVFNGNTRFFSLKLC